MSAELISQLYRAMDVQFQHAQDVPDDDPLRHQKVATRMARYIGMLEGMVVILADGNDTLIQHAIDRFKEPL